MQAQELLATVRAQVLLGSVYVRDALLDPNPATAAEYRRQVEATYDAVTQALLDRGDRVAPGNTGAPRP